MIEDAGSDQSLAEIDAAVRMLNYAVEKGEAIDHSIASMIRTYQGTGTLAGVPPDSRATFDQSVATLAALVRPATASTLAATDRQDGERSAAFKWSRVLWWWTALTVFLVLFAENWEALLFTGTADGPLTDGPPPLSVVSWAGVAHTILQSLVPFLYGGLGACAFLLRACHNAIHDRTFDSRRKPEYLNRLLLGFIAGGSANLFYEYLTDDETQLSAAALAFLVGYNTDFLFSTLERIVAAVLRKDDAPSPPSSAAPASPPPAPRARNDG